MSKQIKKEFFEITCVHRDDIQHTLSLLDSQVSKITNDIMTEIADKMADAYCEQLFDNSLYVIAGKVLENHNII